MTTAFEWAAPAVGLLLVGAGLREVFHTLLHPSGVGQFTPLVFRGMWRLSARAGVPRRGLAGPAAMALSILLWALMLLVGWALVYWPSLPDHFHIAPGIPAAEQGGLLDAVYLSAVALSTLGFGDIVATADPLRIALITEALIGFILLTASISWVLSIYPALARRRALAARIATLLEDAGGSPRLADGDSAGTLSVVLHRVADEIANVRVDLLQYPSSYYFHAPADDLSLAAALPRLRQALAQAGLPGEIRAAGRAVERSVSGLARALEGGPFGLRAGDGNVIDAYAADHRE